MIFSKNRVKTLKMICCTSFYKSCVRGKRPLINEIQVSWGHNHQNHSLITEPLRVTSDQLATVFLHFSVTKTMAVALQLTATIIYTSLYKSLDPCYWSITAASPDRLFVATHMCLAPGSLNTEHAFLSTHISTCSSGGSPCQDKMLIW